MFCIAIIFWFETALYQFQDFSITQFSREINLWDSINANFAILTHLQALNFEFYQFLHFLKAAVYQIDKLLRPKIGKNDSIRTTGFSKTDFHVKSEWQNNPEFPNCATRNTLSCVVS